MTKKIDTIIKIAILGLLVYMAVSIKQLQDEVFPDTNIMIPLMQPLTSK